MVPQAADVLLDDEVEDAEEVAEDVEEDVEDDADEESEPFFGADEVVEAFAGLLLDDAPRLSFR